MEPAYDSSSDGDQLENRLHHQRLCKIYDLVSEPDMTGTFQAKAVINLYYKERAKTTISHQVSERGREQGHLHQGRLHRPGLSEHPV
ncbi:MAG: hypothetical protein V8S34_06405 [Lawsonibacter sp.]